jgi:hypothetical protein
MFGKIFKFLILAAICWYLYWPYHCTDKFRKALKNGDAKAIEAMVDWEAVNESIKDVARDAASKFAEVRLGRSQLTGSESKQVERVINERVPGLDVQDVFKEARLTSQELDRTSWTSPREFTMRFKESDVIWRFRISNFAGWKLAGFELDETALREAVKAHEAARTPPPTPQPPAQPSHYRGRHRRMQ